MKNEQQIDVLGTKIKLLKINEKDYVNITDIAKVKNLEFPRYVIQNWMKTKSTIEFLGLWENLNNKDFNRVEFDTVKNEAGSNSFVLTPTKWIKLMNPIGIISKSGKYGGGTYAHKDIAFEFANWISVEFRLYFIKEFQRLKENENKKMDWNAKRFLTKVNYRIHTDAIKENLIPKTLSPQEISFIYANEADVLNKALFGMTAKEWKEINLKKKGNARDYASIEQLIVLANIESMNSELIKIGMKQNKRLTILNQMAISQMKSLLNFDIKKNLDNH